MKVKCIREGKPDPKLKKKYVPKIGKRYIVKTITNAEVLTGTRNNTWYILKELNEQYHHSSLFEIIDIEEDEAKSLLSKYHREFNNIKLLNKILMKY